MLTPKYPNGAILNDRYEVCGSAFGGMGEVIFCRDLESTGQKMVALKTYCDEYIDDDEALSSFIREAENMLSLGATGYGLDQIIGFDSIVTIEGKPFIKMEYCAGGNLRSHLASHSLGREELGLIATRIILGISRLHVHGIVHRDLKPENILFDSNHDLRISDFGISKILEKRFSGDLATLSARVNQTSASGTLPYMSPEQLRGYGDIDFRSDLWAFAVMLLEMINGYRPFAGSSIDELLLSILSGSPSGLNKIPRHYPKKLAAIIGKCLRKDREDRYLMLDDFIRDWDETIRLNSSPKVKSIFSRDDRIVISDEAVNVRWVGLFFPDRTGEDVEYVKFSFKEQRLLRDAKAYYYKLGNSAKAFESCSELLGKVDDSDSVICRFLAGGSSDYRTFLRAEDGTSIARLSETELTTALEVQLKALVDLIQNPSNPRYDEYVSKLVKAILESGFKDETVLSVVCQLLFFLNDYQQAETLARTLVERNPQNINAWNTLVYSLKSHRDFDGALAAARMATEANSDSEDPRENSILATMCANLKVWENAIIFGERSLVKEPNDFQTQYVVCISKYNLNKKAEARENFLRIRELNPDSAEVEKLHPLFADVGN